MAVNEDWEVDTAVLRTWLRKLRGICTHPQVGQLQQHADKLHKPGVLKSIGEVLEVNERIHGVCPWRITHWDSFVLGNERPELAQLHGRPEE